MEVPPAVTLLGCSERALTAGGSGYADPVNSEAESFTEPPRVAVTITGDTVGASAVTLKRPIFEPDGTVTVDGTGKDALLLKRLTGVLAGAGTLSVTRFALKLPGPVKHCLSNATEETLGAATTLSTVWTLLLPIAAVSVVAGGAPARVLTGKVAVVRPAATTTLAGTVTLLVRSLLVSVTGWPPEGAGPLIVTCPKVELPARTGLSVRETALI
jgi:hypothetical protein